MESSVFRNDARIAFLRAIAKHDLARTVLETLADEPFRVYSATASIGPSRKWSLISVASERLLPVLVPLRSAIAAWMIRWHIDAPWVGDVALETLREWGASQSLLERHQWAMIPSTWMMPEAPGFEPWTPFGDESANDARRRIKAFCEAQLAEITRQEKEARERGLPTGPSGHQLQTIDWTIRFQVLAEPLSKIEVARDVSTVREAVHGFLRYIDLPLRQSSAGRPAGSRDHAGLHR